MVFGFGEKKGPEGGSMKEMVETLASLSEEERKTMMETRLKGFLAMSDSERKNGMAMMLDAATELPQEKFEKLVRTRLSVLMGFRNQIK